MGLMSGTSLDGLDIALVRWNSGDIADFTVEATQTLSYPREFRQQVIESLRGSVKGVCELNFDIGRLWRDDITEFLARVHMKPEQISCIGSHGQTLWHISGDSTLQTGEPAVLSTSLGIPVVSNFRENDIAAGGTGAPLIAFLDWLLYHKLPRKTVVLNIGGIANITCIAGGGSPEEVIGWDTGPGNVVVDTLVQQFSDDARLFDADGAMASAGVINEGLLARLMDDAFIQAAPPKSTGREYFSEAFIQDTFHPEKATTPAEQKALVATASEWTIRAIAQSVTQYWESAEEINRIVISGGGAHNGYFMERLASHFPIADILSCADYGIPVDSKEAVGFAVLAYAFIREIPANIPGVTGASRKVIMGKLTV